MSFTSHLHCVIRILHYFSITQVSNEAAPQGQLPRGVRLLYWGDFNMTDWKRIYQVSRNFIRTQATSGLFVAAVYMIIGILGLVLVTGGRDFEVPLGILFLAIGLVGGIYLGWQAVREYSGDPVILTARILRKQDALSYSRNGTLHRYYLRIEVGKAVRLTSSGELENTIFPRWDLIPASERMFHSINSGETVLLVCTPAGFAFATLDDLRR